MDGMTFKFYMEYAEGTQRLSVDIARNILNDLAPDLADCSDMYVEEYCRSVDSTGNLPDTNRRLGFFADSSLLLSIGNEWLAAIVCGIVVEMVHDYIRNRQMKEDFVKYEHIDSLTHQAQDLAIQNGIDESTAIEFSAKFKEALLANPIFPP